MNRRGFGLLSAVLISAALLCGQGDEVSPALRKEAYIDSPQSYKSTGLKEVPSLKIKGKTIRAGSATWEKGGEIIRAVYNRPVESNQQAKILKRRNMVVALHTYVSLRDSPKIVRVAVLIGGGTSSFQQAVITQIWAGP
jgi:hypothetical protein